MDGDAPAPRQPLKVRCSSCSHRWVLCHIPAPLHEVVAIFESAKCPECGSDSRFIFIDKDQT